MKQLYYVIHCKACFDIMGSFPYTDKKFMVSLFSGQFLCNDCTRKSKDKLKK